MIREEKSMYGRKFMGIERSTFLIDATACCAREWRKVRVKGHAAEVLEAAREPVTADAEATRPREGRPQRRCSCSTPTC